MPFYHDPSKVSGLLLGSALILFSHYASASAFLLHEQSAAQLGAFYAGSAAIADDASTNWYNPAGLSQLKGSNFVASGTNISTISDFHGTTTLTSAVPFPPFSLTETESGEAGGGTARLVPALHGSYRINDKVVVGLSIVVPFGLSTHYEPTSIVRYNATESELKTIDVAPSVSYQPVDWLALGIGLDAEYAEVKFDSIIGVATLPLDSLSKNKATDWGYGWHAGVLGIVPQTQTRLGLAYHSNIEQNLHGHSKLHGPLNPLGYESRVHGSVDLPWWLVGSLVQDLGDWISIMGSVEYTHWSSIQNITLKGVETGGATGGTTTSVDTVNYKNVWGFLGAVRVHLSEDFMVTVGGGHEGTPTNNTDRDLRVPDSNRWIASCGIRYVPEYAQKVQLDVGYAHIWGKEAIINKTMPASTQVVTAEGTDLSAVNLLGFQITVQI
jgi:long-chain fatty acid transport protein